MTTQAAKHTTPKPIKHFQPYTSEERANHAASFRLTPGRRNAVGEVYWMHPLIPGVCFPTRRAAIARATGGEGGGK